MLCLHEQVLGTQHLELCPILEPWPWVYDKTGRAAPAEALYKRSMAIRTALLGAEHSKVAESLLLLAQHYQNRGQRGDAERCLSASRHYQRGRQGRRIARLPGHVKLFYRGQLNFAQAARLWQAGCGLSRIHADLPATASPTPSTTWVSTISKMESIWKRNRF